MAYEEEDCEYRGISGTEEELNDCGYCGGPTICQGCEGRCCDEDGDE